MPAGQILDHGDGQAKIQKLRVIHGHQHGRRHGHRRHRSRRPGNRALLPGRAGIPLFRAFPAAVTASEVSSSGTAAASPEANKPPIPSPS